MNLYEINEQILNSVNEDGEIADFEVFNQLQMERTEKIENIALWIKNLLAEAEAIKTEKEKLADREKKAKAKAEQLKVYLGDVLEGQKFSSPKVAITWRTSKSVELDEGFVEWAQKNNPDLLKFKEPEADKTAIKEYMASGNNLSLARIAEKQNIQIK